MTVQDLNHPEVHRLQGILAIPPFPNFPAAAPEVLVDPAAQVVQVHPVVLAAQGIHVIRFPLHGVTLVTPKAESLNWTNHIVRLGSK